MFNQALLNFFFNTYKIASLTQMNQNSRAKHFFRLLKKHFSYFIWQRVKNKILLTYTHTHTHE